MNFYKSDQIPSHLKSYFQEAPDRSVWGGDPICDHEWGDPLPPHHPGQVEQSINSNAVGAGAGGRAEAGNLCLKCNAWRGQLGLENTPEEFVTHLVEVFREARRVLRDDGTLWVNLGDSYSRGDRGNVPQQAGLCASGNEADKYDFESPAAKMGGHPFIKPKDLVGIPWMVALALRNDGWYLRADIVWAKTNGLPESVRDRPTRNHEYIFLLSKKERYFYDMDAVRIPHKGDSLARATRGRSAKAKYEEGPGDQSLNTDEGLDHSCHPLGKNRRTVWELPTSTYPGAHFAVWPGDLVEPMILAGSGAKGCCSKCGTALKRVSDKEWERSCNCPDAEVVPCVVMDIFSGSATTGAVALRQGRDYIGLDQNADYLSLAAARLEGRAAPAARPVVEEGQTSIADMFGSED